MKWNRIYKHGFEFKGVLMMKRQLQGISLILFGILLGIAEGNLNYYIVRHINAIPFGIIGLIIGIIGLAVVFKKEKSSIKK